MGGGRGIEYLQRVVPGNFLWCKYIFFQVKLLKLKIHKRAKNLIYWGIITNDPKIYINAIK
jgi:hypothetical protein